MSEINLNTKKRKFFLVVFAVSIAFTFIYLLQVLDYHQSGTQDYRDEISDLISAAFIAFFILLFTQFTLRKWLRVKKLNLIKIILWFLLETIIIGSVWFLLDFADKGLRISIFIDWMENILTYILFMIIPYFGFILLLHLRDTIISTSLILQKNKQNAFHADHIDFLDEKDINRFTVKVENLLYIQSSDNYVDIFYEEDNAVKKFMLRNTIKNLEKYLAGSSIIRCHRSYMINTSNILSFQKTTTGYLIKLKHLAEIEIPVSKTYISEIKKYF